MVYMPQVTVHAKGLAAIIVFGLPGSAARGSRPAPSCVKAALQLMEIMREGGIPSHAGIDYGPCYCGLVGNISRRCEYTVMGGRVLHPPSLILLCAALAVWVCALPGWTVLLECPAAKQTLGQVPNDLPTGRYPIGRTRPHRTRSK